MNENNSTHTLVSPRISLRKALGVVIVSLMSLSRAAYAVIFEVGQFRLAEQFALPFGLTGLPAIWDAVYSPAMRLSVVFSVVAAIAFFITGVGMLFRKNWSRDGYLGLSALVVIWNIRPLFSGGSLLNATISLTWLCLSVWLLRRESSNQFFQDSLNLPQWLDHTLLGSSIDLLAAAVLVFILIIALVIRAISAVGT